MVQPFGVRCDNTFQWRFSHFLALQYFAHHSPPEGVGIAGEVRLAPWALRVLLRQVDEVAEHAKFDDQKMDIFVK